MGCFWAPEVGERIKFERERLKFSQAEFAKKAGVARNTQVNYEKGRRVPDAQYLARLGKVGTDLDFVLFGERASKNFHTLGANRVLPLVAKHAKIDYTSLLEILALVSQDEADALEKPSIEIYLVSDEKLQALVAALFHKEGKLLREIILRVSQALQKANARLTAVRTVDAVLGFYQTFKESGRVDRRIIETALRVANYDAVTVRDRRTQKTNRGGSLE